MKLLLVFSVNAMTMLFLIFFSFCRSLNDKKKYQHKFFFFLQEHVITHWNETNTDFHNRLVNLYREKVHKLRPEYISSLPECELTFSVPYQVIDTSLTKDKKNQCLNTLPLSECQNYL